MTITEGRCNTWKSSDIHLNLKYEKFQFVHSYLLDRSIVQKCCAKHNSLTVTLCTKIQNEWPEMGVRDEWYFSRFEFKNDSELTSFIAMTNCFLDCADIVIMIGRQNGTQPLVVYTSRHHDTFLHVDIIIHICIYAEQFSYMYIYKYISIHMLGVLIKWLPTLTWHAKLTDLCGFQKLRWSYMSPTCCRKADSQCILISQCLDIGTPETVTGT